jgi:NTE family protein
VNYVYGIEGHTYGTTSGEYKVDSSLTNYTIATHKLWRIKASRTQYFQMSKFFSLGYHAEGVFSEPTRLTDYYANLLMLPSFEPLQHTHGLFLENYKASSYLAGGVIPTFVWASVSPKLLFRTEFYAFFPFSKLSKDDNTHLFTRPSYSDNLRNIYFIYSAALIYHFPILDISLSATYYDRSQTFYRSWFFAINIGYYLGNKKMFD